MRVRPHGSELSSQTDEASVVHGLPEPMRIDATSGLDERKAFLDGSLHGCGGL